MEPKPYKENDQSADMVCEPSARYSCVSKVCLDPDKRYIHADYLTWTDNKYFSMHANTFKNYILALFIFATSCAKEIYTHEDAVNSKRDAQKVGLTVMIYNIGSQATDLSGFTVSTLQLDEEIVEVTSADGIANLKVVKGDVLFHVQKEGYVSVTAVATTNTSDKERNNTVVMVPVFVDTGASGLLNGKVSVKMDSSVDAPLAGAMVSIHLDMNELMRLSFPYMSGNVINYLPEVLSYSLNELMQPVHTNASGAFALAIPVTFADLAYTVNVHETALTQNTFCSAKQTVITDGQNCPAMLFQLTPYEK